MWSVSTETALIVVPEEVEILLPILTTVEKPLTHLLTYAAPVSRKMVHFNSLKYFAVPTLPVEWQPPIWLTIELGIFSGRLFFEFDEYNDLRKYLGYQEDNVRSPTDSHQINKVADEAELNFGAPQVQSFTAKPLVFLLEWLTLRRKGQTFNHTPMGYVVQEKPLVASHPFFAPTNNTKRSKPLAAEKVANLDNIYNAQQAAQTATSCLRK